MLTLVCVPLLLGGACENKKPASDTGAINAMDRANDPGANDTTPLPNVDVSKLEPERQKLFYKLVNSLNSPCGKSENLRKSFTTDTSCKHAPYAVKYIVALVEDEVIEKDAREYYSSKYEDKSGKVKLDVSKAPRVGPVDAPIRIVEFFDYQCPHCRNFAPQLEKVMETHKGKVVEYFMMLPILESKHPGSKSAAQAALAADQQGKFQEMHHKLIENSGGLDKNAVLRYAAEIGLDVAKFQAAYDAASPLIASDEAQADGLGVKGTPAVFFNDRKYEGPLYAEYLGMWIDEELAVNR